MIVDGRKIAAAILADVRERVAGRTPVVRAIVMQPTAATESYLRIKSAKAAEAGMRLELVCMSDTATTGDVCREVVKPGADALIVQLPLPEHIDEKRVLDAIPITLDADVLSTAAYGHFEKGEPGALLPPVAAAVAEILARASVLVRGARVAVVGQGRLVGLPVSVWLAHEGTHVETLTEDSFEEKRHFLKEADIVISGAGSPGLITPSMVREGAALIDAGTSESGGAIVGDFDPACAEVASVFTPVPGGLGPVAVACLFKNAATLLKV